MAIDDRRLEAEVERAIGLLPNVNRNELRVTSSAGRIRIEGVVRNLAMKREALEAAYRTPGVLGVDDAIAVETPRPARDADLTEALDEAIDEDEEVEAMRVGAHAARGQAIMVGTAQSVGELGRAMDTAAEVQNTTNIIDSARIDNPYDADTLDLVNVVADVLRSHPTLHNRQIRPILEEKGRILLRGQVRSDDERLEAIRIVTKVPGLHSIREELEIVP